MTPAKLVRLPRDVAAGSATAAAWFDGSRWNRRIDAAARQLVTDGEPQPAGRAAFGQQPNQIVRRDVCQRFFSYGDRKTSMENRLTLPHSYRPLAESL